MKILITYSSVTGNTKKLAEGIHEVIPQGKLLPVQEALAQKLFDQDFDIIFWGYWANRGTADEKAQEFLGKLKSKNVAAFGTSGQYPDSERGLIYKDRVKKLVEESNVYKGGFLSMGKIQESRTERRKLIPKGQSHYLSEEGLARHIESRKHPNNEDIEKLQKWALEIVEVPNSTS